jgi:hypothetical protein
MPDHAVAVCAKKSSNFASRMIMIYIKIPILRFPTDGTTTRLRGKHFIVSGLSDTILTNEMPFPDSSLFPRIPAYFKVRVPMPVFTRLLYATWLTYGQRLVSATVDIEIAIWFFSLTA